MFSFNNVLAIPPVERRKVVLTFCYTFNTAGAYVVGRSAADALFLARAGSAWLPLMYLLSACSVGLLAVVFVRFANGRSLKQAVCTALLVLCLTSCLLCQLVQEFDNALVLLASIYLVAEIRGCVNTIQYGVLVNELFSGHPKYHHITGMLGAAATLAGVVFGGVVALEVHHLGTVHLLYVAAALELVAMLPIILLPEVETGDSRERDSNPDAELASRGDCHSPVSMGSGLTTAVRSPYVQGIAVLVAVAVIVGTLIEFQWKVSVAASFATDENQMTSFIGIFHAAVNLVTGLIQVLLTGQLLHGLGPRMPLLLFPTALFASTLGVLFASADRVLLSAIIFAKGCDVIKRSVNDPAILMLYAPLSNGARRQAITLVAGIVKPSSEAVAALLIISFAGIVGMRAISYVALALLCVWLIIASRRRTGHLTQVAASGTGPATQLLQTKEVCAIGVTS